MGCNTSKLDDLPAVALCRQRCAFLDEAIHQRYALAEAHLAYVQSLRDVGLSLQRFFDQDLDNSAAEPPSPVLNLPAQRKGDPESSGSPPAAIRLSHSSSGSHLHFRSGSDDENSGSDSLQHHLDDASPVHPYGQSNYADGEALGAYSSGFMNMNYMKNTASPSVLYEQRPLTAETVHMGESYTYYTHPHPNQSLSSYSYYGNSNYGGGTDGFFSSSAYGSSFPPPPGGAVASSSTSTSKAAPPPPSPPKSSAWDFLNPFESFEKFYPPYTPSRDLREVREEEGIPDLEDEDDQREVVKEVHVDQKFMGGDGGGGGGGGGKIYSHRVSEDEDRKMNDSEALYQTRPSVSTENDRVEYDVRVVEKKVVENEGKSADGANTAAFKAKGGLRSDSEVVREIQVQFERASESGNELARMLEAGKLPYQRKTAPYQVSSKMLHVITPFSAVSSQPKTVQSSSVEKDDPGSWDIDEDVGMKPGNLSSTLHKLYLWEKKLYEEVKVEEKMRVLHERKCRRLKRLDERGAEAHKIDSTRTLVGSLSTKIRIAIQMVDKISVKINKLRDEELWPQLNAFIEGVTIMWKSMVDCHRSQCQAIRQARRLDTVASHKPFSDGHLEATLQLEHDLLNWTLKFSCWVGAQKGFVRALNNWLLKCLLYLPEETPDGIAPFSPSRIGAPPVFVICNQWFQALEGISGKEVVDCLRDFSMGVLQLWERDNLKMRQRMVVNKDMERKVKQLEREDQKIHNEIQALDKVMALVSGDGNGVSATEQVVYQSDTSSSLQVSLQRIFEAMEKFTANSLKAYEELLQRIEEDGLIGEHEKVS